MFVPLWTIPVFLILLIWAFALFWPTFWEKGICVLRSDLIVAAIILSLFILALWGWIR